MVLLLLLLRPSVRVILIHFLLFPQSFPGIMSREPFGITAQSVGWWVTSAQWIIMRDLSLVLLLLVVPCVIQVEPIPNWPGPRMELAISLFVACVSWFLAVPALQLSSIGAVSCELVFAKGKTRNFVRSVPTAGTAPPLHLVPPCVGQRLPRMA